MLRDRHAAVREQPQESDKEAGLHGLAVWLDTRKSACQRTDDEELMRMTCREGSFAEMR